MPKQVIISDVRHRKKPYIAFFGYGGVYAERDYVFYTTELGTDEKAISLEKEVIGSTGCTTRRFRKKDKKPFEILQVIGPAEIRKDLPKRFRSPKYTEQLREFANPGTIADVDEIVLEDIVKKEEFNRRMENLRHMIEAELPDKNPGYHTAVLNRLNRMFVMHKQSELSENTYTKKLSEKIISERQQMQDLFLKIKERKSYNNKKQSLELILPSLDKIKPKRMMNYDEIMQQKWLFLDIEVPRFKTNSEISWVGMTYYERGSKTKEIHTLRDLGEETYKEYKIIKYNSQKELVEGVRESVLKQNPYYVSSFNTKFDLLKLRETDADFFVGDERTIPIMEATSPSFERIGIHGREVVDLLRWAQIALAYLPNKKLEMVLKHLFGDESFKKSINYEELEKLETLAIAGDKNAARQITDYLAGDVDGLLKIFESKIFQGDLNLSAELSQDFHIPLSWVLYNANSLNLSQRRSYLEHVGIHPDNVYLKTAKFKKARTLTINKFKRILEDGLKSKISAHQGTYENVTKAHIPYGFYLQNLIRVRYPDINKLQKKNLDNHQEYFLSRYADHLAELMTNSYAALKMLQEKAAKTEETGMLIKTEERSESDKLLERVEKQYWRIKGNYAVLPYEIEYDLNMMFSKIKRFMDINNLKLIHQDGASLYFTGGDEHTFDNAPVIKTDEIEQARISVKNNNQSLTYEKHGYFNKRKRTDTKQMVLF